MGGLVDALADGLIGGRVQEIADLVVQTFGQARPHFVIQTLVGALPAFVALDHEGMQALCERLGRGWIVVDTNDAQVAVQQAIAAEVVQRRHQQALDQIAVGAEQEQRAGRRGRDALCRHLPFSTWPPKPRRMAERILSP